MGCNVFANGDEIACKAGAGQVIASFPDVCLTPPPTPAGPIPTPYADTSFSKDMQSGSKTVMIKDQEVMLKDQSFYKTSPLGDEAATDGLGASVITHVITGKTYFNAWSMDVQFEGANVDRHTDLTTSNHASYPGGTPPNPNKAEQQALDRLAVDECPCCGRKGGQCPAGLSQTFSNGKKREAYSHREFYCLDETDASGALSAKATARRAQVANHPCTGGSCPNAGKPERKSDPPCDVYRVTTDTEKAELEKNRHVPKAELRDHFGVPEAKGAIVAFFAKTPGGTIMNMTESQWNAKSLEEKNKVVKIDHVTPRAAGGCPSSKENTVSHGKKCDNCQKMDGIQDSWNGDELTSRRAALGI